jgi:sigma-54 dependent transcriptional regulator, acetoin dehydrogenase operon transcriptional activator AcoR
MTFDPRGRADRSPPIFDYSDVDAKETSRAWKRFLEGRDSPSLPVTGVRPVIYRSWLRSNSTGIRPEQYAAPTLDGSPSNAISKHDNADMRRATQNSLVQIGQLLSGAEAILILTDRDGVILDTVGDGSTMDKANRINLRVGGIWSEQASGTNGIGTALWAGHPVFVHGEEHFCEGMKAWSCAAAPIRDPVDHSIIGAINLSGLTSIFQKHNAAFAATAAREIEIALEREQSLLNMRLLEAIIGSVPMQSDGVGEGIAVVDRFGRLIFNRNCAALPQFAASGPPMQTGTRLLDLEAGLSEDSILSALPADHDCKEIRLINIDGAVKGAALVFKPSHNRSPRSRPDLPALPGTIIPGSDLKIVGQSPAILAALDAATRMAAANSTILIEGQTGVGKQLFARLIHAEMDPGNRAGFAPINCGAISQAILDEGLAARRAAQSASRRTHDDPAQSPAQTPVLILDEIGELPADFQTHLLHVLENWATENATQGRHTETPRSISLTNRAMLDEIAAGRFRRDLFYRLGAMTLKIPPLKDRGEDILLIAEHYNRKISADTGRGLLTLRSDVQEALMTHDWPGNVRELRNVISGLHFMSKERTVTLTDLPQEVVMRRTASLADADTGPPQPDLTQDHPMALKDAELRMIRAAITAQHGNLSRVAAVLGISRPTLYRKIQGYGITVGRSG